MISPMDLILKVKKQITECDNKQLCQAIDSQSLLIDVREPGEYQAGFIAHAINIPRGLVEFAIFDHPKVKPQLDRESLKDTPIYLYCKSGGRSALAAESLQRLGFEKVFSLSNGIQSWENEGFKVNKEATYSY